MITIQNVGEALHLIETQVFKDLEIDPFQKNKEELVYKVNAALNVFLVSTWEVSKLDLKKSAINLAASLTRLISELP